MTGRLDAWPPERGDLAYDERSGRTGVVVALPEDTGAGVYHLCPEGGGNEWPALLTHLHPGDRQESTLLTDRLAVWAGTRGATERVAVAALVEEGDVLARGDVRDLLVADTGTAASCDWPRFEARYRNSLVLDASERAFLDFVVAVSFPRLVPLWQVEHLGERRLVVVLRALVALAGASSTVTVGGGSC
ncbi:hypothetical protein ACWD6I_23635 [Streptomyces sp. NPDC002454]